MEKIMKQFSVPVLLVINSDNEDQATQQAKEFMLAAAFEFRKIYDLHDFDVLRDSVSELE
jgi:hypothetical protein